MACALFEAERQQSGIHISASENLRNKALDASFRDLVCMRISFEKDWIPDVPLPTARSIKVTLEVGLPDLTSPDRGLANDISSVRSSNSSDCGIDVGELRLTELGCDKKGQERAIEAVTVKCGIRCFFELYERTGL